MADRSSDTDQFEMNLPRGAGAPELYELGGRRLAAGDAAGAVVAYQQCLRLGGDEAAVYNNLGSALMNLRQWEAAIGSLESALTRQPRYTRALVNLGRALREAGHPAKAIGRSLEALSLQPNYAPAWVNLGDAHAAVGDMAAAIEALERAVRLSPDLVEAHMSLGIAYLQTGRSADSVSVLRKAVALSPHHPDAHANLGHALFVAGDWAAAWPHFEYRHRRAAAPVDLHIPPGMARWDGRIAQGVRLRLIGEQGLGDQLQFARYVRVLAKLDMECEMVCDPRLVTLLHEAELGDVRSFAASAPRAGDTRWFPLQSLPCWHGTRADTVPGAAGYLSMDPRRVERWARRLDGVAGFKVGLAWAGNPLMETGRHAGRSPPIAALSPLLAASGVHFISLQKGSRAADLDHCPLGHRTMRLPDLDPGPDAFLDTGAILKCVDLLVTSDSAIAHLAGALGVPTWLCLMHEPDWRWMLTGSITPWYDSVRLFRQPARGDWAAVFREVTAALEREARTGGPATRGTRAVSTAEPNDPRTRTIRGR